MSQLKVCPVPAGELEVGIALEEHLQGLTKQGLIPAGGEPERLSKLVRVELERWTRVIAEAKIRAD